MNASTVRYIFIYNVWKVTPLFCADRRPVLSLIVHNVQVMSMNFRPGTVLASVEVLISALQK